ncbi:uncharacterized protein MONOS_6811 [Monocercomonoides exilis]|uniref:uncharacterized protein n=1 Tax=Monocercomonoides exilis TaxID=2049356 RepID=UPI0035595C7A|nr:hypothetical protein MONOS_6811 [Monocercomonoides exilis]|eukprot:MONOS_6811.1-p1 / transcript=MONOS_6811.1 / gene=MONOS_6811 / organism=Monocercomonoides_exilis_PA203 / gene_product=unspecified product / transcript_product=unspecified product / location=Mono_scaffold00222:5870-6727(+) / protein_length=200 / sequence_SO=supercontig / SO=protein_coding / is_pseudo=false
MKNHKNQQQSSAKSGNKYYPKRNKYIATLCTAVTCGINIASIFPRFIEYFPQEIAYEFWTDWIWCGLITFVTLFLCVILWIKVIKKQEIVKHIPTFKYVYVLLAFLLIVQCCANRTKAAWFLLYLLPSFGFYVLYQAFLRVRHPERYKIDDEELRKEDEAFAEHQRKWNAQHSTRRVRTTTSITDKPYRKNRSLPKTKK